MNVWLSSSILTWFPLDGGGSYLDLSKRQRSYEQLQRAEFFLTRNAEASDDDRTDCISNLRRCLSHRMKQIESVYNLRSILREPKKRHYLEVLADFGLVRPALIKGLLSIRNDVEYNDAIPPETSKCHDLVDASWYFLRSTDALLYTVREDIELHPPDDPWNSVYGCTLRLIYTPLFEAELVGWFPPDFVSTTEKPVDLLVDAKDFHTKADSPFQQNHPDKKDDDLWINGTLLLRPQECRVVISRLLILGEPG